MRREVALLSIVCFLLTIGLIIVSASADNYWNLYAYQGKIIRASGGWECLGDIGWQKSEIWAHRETWPNPHITDHKGAFSGSGASGVWGYVFPWECVQTHREGGADHNNVRAWRYDICQYSLYIYVFIESDFTRIPLGSYTTTSTAEVFA